jgi:Fur family ferric uptake transcriptional regulator
MSCHKMLLATLHERGLRRTPQRTAILEQLCHNHGHHTAEHIFRLARRQLPDLNIATVYRTLETLRAARVVTAIATPEGPTEFELSRPEVRHHHLRCRRCGGEWLLPPQPVERLEAWIGRHGAFQPELDHLVITGLCASCARLKSATRVKGD